MPSATFTVSSGSDRIIELRGPSSGGSASVHSPTSSGRHSFSSASTDSWSQVEAEDEDGIEPSDSASRSKHPTSRRYTTEAQPPPPARRHSSRRVILEQDESPPPRVRRHHSSRTQHSSSRHRRTESRRTPSDESASVASYDDYPYSHHGAPQPPRPYPPPSGYRHVPAPGHGGYPPAPAPYIDPFVQQQQAMVHLPHQDPFGYPGRPNPFSPQSQQQNPFSPMSQVSGNSYFATDPPAPQPPTQHLHRPPGPQRPMSFVGPPSHFGSEMAMTPYGPYSSHPGMASPYGYGQMPWPMPGMPMPPQLPSLSSSPAPDKPNPETEKFAAEIDALKSALQQKDDAEKAKTTEEIENMKLLLKKYEEAQAAREKAEIAKKAEEEADKKRKEEIAAATKKAKEDAEKKAEDAAKKAQDEHEKKLAEVMKAQEEAEKKQKELEEEAAKNKPMPDTLKPPIKFKDAVGRKFSFPWHLCKTWKGMELLIKQAFCHVEVIGDHVHAGHYDLTGPDGEIILPQVWDTMVQPDWEITMHMWPMPEEKKPKEEDKIVEEFGDPLQGMFGSVGIVEVPPSKKPKGDKKGKDKKVKKSASPEVIPVPPALPTHGHAPPRNLLPGMIPDHLAGYPGGVHMMEDKKRPKPRTKSNVSPFTQWMAGTPRVPKKDDEKLELVKHKTNHSSTSHSDQTSCVIM